MAVLKTQTGEVAWEEEAGWSVSCSRALVFTTVEAKSSISALEISTGQRYWSGTKPRKSFYGQIYNPETREIIAKESNIPETYYIVDSETGNLKQSFEKVATPPDDGSWARGPMYLIDRNQLFISGTVLDAQNGQVIHKEDRYYSRTPPTVTSNMIYLADTRKGVVALDRVTFKVNWVYQPQHKLQWLPSLTLSSVAILDEVGYAIFSDGTLRAFDLETGQELGYWQLGLFDLWRWPVCTFPPIPGCSPQLARAGLATSEDTLFVSFGDGKLYAFEQ